MRKKAVESPGKFEGLKTEESLCFWSATWSPQGVPTGWSRNDSAGGAGKKGLSRESRQVSLRLRRRARIDLAGGLSWWSNG